MSILLRGESYFTEISLLCQKRTRANGVIKSYLLNGCHTLIKIKFPAFSLCFRCTPGFSPCIFNIKITYSTITITHFGSILLLIPFKLQSPMQWSHGGIMSFHYWDILLIPRDKSQKPKYCRNIILQHIRIYF